MCPVKVKTTEWEFPQGTVLGPIHRIDRDVTWMGMTKSQQEYF